MYRGLTGAASPRGCCFFCTQWQRPSGQGTLVVKKKITISSYDLKTLPGKNVITSRNLLPENKVQKGPLKIDKKIITIASLGPRGFLIEMLETAYFTSKQNIMHSYFIMQ